MVRPQRLWLVVVSCALSSACTMDNPAFNEDHADELGGDSKGATGSETGADEVGTDQGSSESESSSEESTSGESSSEESTSGESSSEEGPFDTGGVDTGPLDTGGNDVCVAPDPNDLCMDCITSMCCEPGIVTCLSQDSDCHCVLTCLGEPLATIPQCVRDCGTTPEIGLIASLFLDCTLLSCAGVC